MCSAEPTPAGPRGEQPLWAHTCPPSLLTAGVSVSFAQKTLGRKRAHKGSFKDGECGLGAAVGRAGPDETGLAGDGEGVCRDSSGDQRSLWPPGRVALMGLERPRSFPWTPFCTVPGAGDRQSPPLTPGDSCPAPRCVCWGACGSHTGDQGATGRTRLLGSLGSSWGTGSPWVKLGGRGRQLRLGGGGAQSSAISLLSGGCQRPHGEGEEVPVQPGWSTRWA